jgi:hypothetical protein
MVDALAELEEDDLLRDKTIGSFGVRFPRLNEEGRLITAGLLDTQ